MSFERMNGCGSVPLFFWFTPFVIMLLLGMSQMQLCTLPETCGHSGQVVP
jgi:hypothetical protein